MIYVNVDENPGKNYFSLYPNPADEVVRVHFFKSDFQSQKDLKFIINDVFGRNVKEIPGLDGDESIDISCVPNGIYFVKLLEENKVICTKKLFVAR